MAIENSVFADYNQINAFLKRIYGFPESRIEKVREGSANCYIVKNTWGDFFLKEFQTKYYKEMIEKEIEVCKRILTGGIPTSEFIPGLDGSYVLEYQDHCLHLQKYIDGFMFEKHTVEDAVLNESAEVLGKIHVALKGVDFLPNGFPKDWFESWSAEQSINRHQMILDRVKLSTIPQKEKIVDACERKIRLLREYKENFTQYDRLTRVNSHGDYSHLQILCDNQQNKIKAVVDFSGASFIPAVWEIIRSYSYGAVECGKPEINFTKLKEYVDYYLKYGSLSLFDVSNMAGFYYYNLLRSTYGLNSNNGELIEFALWRTDFCEYLSKAYRDIDAYLCKEYKTTL